MALTNSCEQADLKKSEPNDLVQITTRGDCDDCPGANECCCSITLTSGSRDHYFDICGTTDGDAVACEIDPTDCNFPIDGWEHTSFFLNSFQPTELFCVNEETGFAIGHTTSGNVTLTLTCQRGQISPQSINISFSGTQKKQYEVDDACIVSECQ